MITMGEGKGQAVSRWFFDHALASWADPYVASLLFALLWVSGWYAVLWVLDRRNIVWKL